MATMQQEEKMYNAMFGDECTCTCDNISIDELDQSIAECSAMLNYSIQTNDKAEQRFWRRMLQSAKVQRRELLTA